MDKRNDEMEKKGMESDTPVEQGQQERNRVLYKELVDKIQRDKEQGREVLISGDFNEEDVPGSLMREYMRGEGLINVFVSKVAVVPPTRSPGRRKVR